VRRYNSSYHQRAVSEQGKPRWFGCVNELAWATKDVLLHVSEVFV